MLARLHDGQSEDRRASIRLSSRSLALIWIRSSLLFGNLQFNEEIEPLGFSSAAPTAWLALRNASPIRLSKT
ncbi:UNVERIFIED_CONTAM: hypothetical protein Sradi_1000600 [Sesamum radiatum]|uniref:Uncharacterized protein n=1 Tax=Sesamum radiatum TaxID=300843 RepID=A0AAW2V6H8_SESRA